MPRGFLIGAFGVCRWGRRSPISCA